ncbi:hypothetical protein PIB30_083810 [Stylosanthes scabra]|uniref:Uncharacterized protein n=1 Tax=Stylosanthes scabra TaxID=79078 RepID=A0ABU6WVM1_9FABA|nr:hypothetical protein [Stylosanthes scabra]
MCLYHGFCVSYYYFLLGQKTSISCTLFGELVDKIQPFLDGDQTAPLIVVFQLFRAKEWNGKINIQGYGIIAHLMKFTQLKTFPVNIIILFYAIAFCSLYRDNYGSTYPVKISRWSKIERGLTRSAMWQESLFPCRKDVTLERI